MSRRFLRWCYPRRCFETLTDTKLMLHIIWSIIVGFIIGWLAQALYPGAQHLGFWKAALIGIGGSILGGLISRLFSRPQPGSPFHPAGFFMSLFGALILLWACTKFGLLKGL